MHLADNLKSLFSLLIFNIEDDPRNYMLCKYRADYLDMVKSRLLREKELFRKIAWRSDNATNIHKLGSIKACRFLQAFFVVWNKTLLSVIRQFFYP